MRLCSAQHGIELGEHDPRIDLLAVLLVDLTSPAPDGLASARREVDTTVLDETGEGRGAAFVDA